ncbi:hypothetical protein [Sphaerisporangium sp. TRM90804]|uniref:hypothetical protein n=1 Tax=Sphaerisporangium sp. TRM90804 TaxID=3031113 RepID=UPI00244CE0CC|nr:hypothetical protein [Sphaerisporangium sp. TRM90804]MDH2426449.1 hypothetical protein [Sphaerisporangium sp. TRM90804]
MIADVNGHDIKPDPLQANTLEELADLLRAFWEWAGRPSYRDVARASGNTFSNGTAGKVLAGPSCRAPFKLEYVQGCIRGCGGDEEEVRRWTTAWRKVSNGRPSLTLTTGGGDGY